MHDEIYPRAPVQFVTFEIEFPMAPALDRTDGREQVYDGLADEFPLLEAVNAMQVQFSLGGGAQGLPFPQAGGQQIRMTNRHRTTSVVVGATVARIEQAAHVRFEDLRELIAKVLDAIGAAARLQGLQRASLRYINEIQHPDGTSPTGWSHLLHPALAGPIDLLEATAEKTEGATLFRLDPQHLVRVVYGTEATGFVVNPNGPLRIQPRTLGPFFRLDTESTWTAPPEEVPVLVADEVVAIADRLHGPIRLLFEAALNPDLREYFRSPA